MVWKSTQGTNAIPLSVDKSQMVSGRGKKVLCTIHCNWECVQFPASCLQSEIANGNSKLSSAKCECRRIFSREPPETTHACCISSRGKGLSLRPSIPSHSFLQQQPGRGKPGISLAICTDQFFQTENESWVGVVTNRKSSCTGIESLGLALLLTSWYKWMSRFHNNPGMDRAVRPVLFPLSTAAARSHRKTRVKGEKIIKLWLL